MLTRFNNNPGEEIDFYLYPEEMELVIRALGIARIVAGENENSKYYELEKGFKEILEEENDNRIRNRRSLLDL